LSFPWAITSYIRTYLSMMFWSLPSNSLSTSFCCFEERGVFCTKRKVHIRIQSVIESDDINDQPTYLFILILAAERRSVWWPFLRLFLGIRVSSFIIKRKKNKHKLVKI
jgi:hypothetical protein